MVKKIVWAMVMTLVVTAPLFAKGKKTDKNAECYERVKGWLNLTPQFNYVLPDAWPQGMEEVTVNCTDRSRGLGALPPDLKPGDKVTTLMVDATVVIHIQPRVQGRPLGGFEERVNVTGDVGYVYGREDDNTYFDLVELSYRKTDLRGK